MDKAGFKGGIPEIQGMTVTDNLPAYVERKLFTLNTGHAITAYLGKAMGYQTIRSSISDPTIYNYFKSAMEESGAALVKTYGFDPEAHSNYINKIINRFKNPYLDDSVDRVGREPLRKLSRNDRLIKPLMMALEYGIDPENLIVGAAAAFTFNNNDDPQAAELQTRIKNNGITNTVAEVTGLEGHPRIVDRIVEAYQKMKNR